MAADVSDREVVLPSVKDVATLSSFNFKGKDWGISLQALLEAKHTL